MAFNNGNNNRERANTNTQALTLRNMEGSSPSALAIGFWNSLLSLRIHPPLEKSKITENNFFDWDQGISTALTIEKIVTMSGQIDEYILPALGTVGKTEFKGVNVGDNSIVGIGVRWNDDGPSVYIAIYKGLDENSKKPESGLTYTFRTSFSVDHYSPESGDLELSKVQGEFRLFAQLLKVAVIGLSNATVHADRNVNKFYKDKVMGTLESVAGKVGATVGPSASGGGGYNRTGGGNVFNSYSANTDAGRNLGNHEASVSTLDNISDIDGFL